MTEDYIAENDAVPGVLEEWLKTNLE